MRLHEILAEDAEADVDAHMLAIQLRGKIIRHFMDSEKAEDFWGGRAVRMTDGRKYVLFDTAIFGWPAPYDDSYFAIEGMKEPGTPSGAVTKLKQSGKSMVILRCVPDPAEDIEEAARMIVYKGSVHEVLLHEITHLIDMKSDRREPVDRDTYTSDTKNPKYWNHPLEFNAYFHNVSSRLINFINRAKHHRSPEAILSDARTNKITADFWETFAKSLKDVSLPQVRSFLDNLDPQRRRRLLARLYKLHREAVEYIRWAEVHRAPIAASA